MKISYLIFSHNETYTLNNLLIRILRYKNDSDEIILSDDFSTNKETQKIIDTYSKNIKIVQYKLENGYSEKKNKALKHCDGEFIFAIDGDELPSETLLFNIKDIIQSNSDIEAFWIPRINDFIGVHNKIAKQWGWNLSPSTSITHEKVIDINSDEYHFLKNNGYIVKDYDPLKSYLIDNKTVNTITYKAVLVNSYDPQCRLFLNKPEIKWVGRLHERIEGNKNYVYLPFEEELAIYHDKSIEKQIETNLRYNTKFTLEENKGFNLPE